MKKVFLFVAMSLLLFSSCKKDDDNEQEGVQQGSSFIQIGDDSAVDLSYGFATDYGHSFGDGESFNIDLLFSNYNLDAVANSTSVPNDLLSLYFEVFSSIENRLEPGIYEYNETGAEFTFSYASILLANESEIFIDSGVLEILSSETDSYELIFEGIDEDGNEIYFEYTDSVDYNVDSVDFFLSKSANNSISKNK